MHRLQTFITLVMKKEELSADDIERGGLTAARGTKDRHKLAVAEIQRNAAQRVDHVIANRIGFDNILELKHDT